MKKILIAFFALVVILVNGFSSKLFAGFDEAVLPRPQVSEVPNVPPLVPQIYLDLKKELYYGGEGGTILTDSDSLSELKTKIEAAIEANEGNPDTIKLLNQLINKVNVQLGLE